MSKPTERDYRRADLLMLVQAGLCGAGFAALVLAAVLGDPFLSIFCRG